MAEFKTAYGPKDKVAKGDWDRSMTKQSMKDECDIRFIIDKFKATGMLQHKEHWQGQYGEFEAMDFQEAMNYILDAKEMFETIPSNIRKRFDNDPGQFISWVNDPENASEARKLGFLNPLPKPLENPEGEAVSASQPENPA